jgi:hypothetical protein
MNLRSSFASMDCLEDEDNHTHECTLHYSKVHPPMTEIVEASGAEALRPTGFRTRLSGKP